jgi:hypothetical protein
VTLKGARDGNAVSYTLVFTLCEADNINASAAVHCLATKLQIKLLQDQEAESTAKRLQLFFFETIFFTNKKNYSGFPCQKGTPEKNFVNYCNNIFTSTLKLSYCQESFSFICVG